MAEPPDISGYVYARQQERRSGSTRRWVSYLGTVGLALATMIIAVLANVLTNKVDGFVVWIALASLLLTLGAGYIAFLRRRRPRITQTSGQPPVEVADISDPALQEMFRSMADSQAAFEASQPYAPEPSEGGDR